jgi:uncharacterized protein YjbI with pentapeptide repeats
MANADHLKLLRQGVAAWNAWRTEEPLATPDLIEADLSEANLREANLREADLSWANLRGASLAWADLSEAHLKGAHLFNANLRGASLDRADLCGASLDRADLGRALAPTTASSDHQARPQASLYRADLSLASLSLANLSEADLSEANLAWATLGGTNLHDANLSGANLGEARLNMANLSLANLSGANLGRANLQRANLERANLSGADLSVANLQQANLVDARLDNANLTGARLWETQRDGWSIKEVICQRAHWDREGGEATDYGEGEFERIFAEKPRIVVRYPGGISPMDLLALPLVVERLQAEHAGSVLRIRSVQNDAGGASVTITVEDLENRGSEAFEAQLLQIRTELECTVKERDFLRQLVAPFFSEGLFKVADALAKISALPRQVIHLH